MSTHAIPLGGKCPHMPIFIGGQMSGGICPYISSPWTISLRGFLSESESESELLLVTRSNDNHSPGPVMREVSP